MVCWVGCVTKLKIMIVFVTGATEEAKSSSFQQSDRGATGNRFPTASTGAGKNSRRKSCRNLQKKAPQDEVELHQEGSRGLQVWLGFRVINLLHHKTKMLSRRFSCCQDAFPSRRIFKT